MFAIFRNGLLYGLATKKEVEKMDEEAKFAGGYVVMEYVQTLKELQVVVGREFNAFEVLTSRHNHAR